MPDANATETEALQQPTVAAVVITGTNPNPPFNGKYWVKQTNGRLAFMSLMFILGALAVGTDLVVLDRIADWDRRYNISWVRGAFDCQGTTCQLLRHLIGSVGIAHLIVGAVMMFLMGINRGWPTIAWLILLPMAAVGKGLMWASMAGDTMIDDDIAGVTGEIFIMFSVISALFIVAINVAITTYYAPKGEGGKLAAKSVSGRRSSKSRSRSRSNGRKKRNSASNSELLQVDG